MGEFTSFFRSLEDLINFPDSSNMAVVDHSCTVRIYNKSQEKTMEFSTGGPLIYDFLWDKLDDTLCYAIGEKRFYRKLRIEGEKLVES